MINQMIEIVLFLVVLFFLVPALVVCAFVVRDAFYRHRAHQLLVKGEVRHSAP